MKKLDIITKILMAIIIGCFAGFVVWFGVITKTYMMMACALLLIAFVIAMGIYNNVMYTYDYHDESQEEA